MNYKISHK